MANDLVRREAGLTPEALNAARQGGWSLSVAASIFDRNAVAAGIAAIRAEMAPLSALEPIKRGVDNKWHGRCAEVRNWLKPFGMAIAPGLNPDARTNWLNALLVSLADLPPAIAIAAAQEALHVPCTFLNEVHGNVRAAANHMLARQRLALDRLQDLDEQLARAANGPKALPPQAEGAPLSADEIRKMPAYLIKMGLERGWLDQAGVDAALAAPSEPTEGASIAA